ncbi:MAG: Txe/YoeB family addiction module toxin [Flavobacteriales bacterium]|nr:Txe/YoeB family addiction module toxin [Flavobacteriales bacterium]
MRRLVFEQGAYDDFCDWGIYDRQRFLKIHDLLKAILREPFRGVGKPEALKGRLRGCWSRRIDDTHRLVYRITAEGDVEILSCKGHYGDK